MNDYIQRKRVLPSELTTKQYQELSAYTLERGFVMACVTNAKTLDKNKALAAAILRGDISPAAARESLRRYYEESNYQPPAGAAGTIKDLRTVRRMKATLDTNVAMAQGWKRKEDLRGNIAKPALELYRAQQAREPRDWESAWAKAYAEVGGKGAAKSRMVALHDSPIWVALSEFNRPHPPFDWGSKMGIRPVSLAEAVKLGLIADPKSPEGREQLQKIRDEGKAKRSSLNEDVRMECQISDKDIQQDLAKSLKGLAEWDGRTIRLTDVNGTRPYAWDELGDVITAPNSAGVPLLQAEASKRWFENSEQFKRGHPRYDPEMTEAMRNVISRTIPSVQNEGEFFWRGMGFKTEKERDEYLDLIQKVGKHFARQDRLAESWSSSDRTAQDYSQKNGVILVCHKSHSMRRIDGLYHAVMPISSTPSKPLNVEAERLMPSDIGLNIIKIEKKDGKYYVHVQE